MMNNILAATPNDNVTKKRPENKNKAREFLLTKISARSDIIFLSFPLFYAQSKWHEMSCEK